MSKIKDTPIFPPSKSTRDFSNALLLGMSPVQNSLFDIPDYLPETQKLNTSASNLQGDTSSIMNDLLSTDLLQKIEQLSPITSSQQIKTRMSDVIMINCDEDNNSSSQSSNDSDLYNSSGTSEELELKEDIKSKKKSKKNEKPLKRKEHFVLNDPIKNSNNMPHHLVQKMKNFEKKFNNSFSAGVNNSNNDQVFVIDGVKHSNSIGGTVNNTNMNKSQVYSYYNSTSRYLSQVLQIEETERNESKGGDSLNNSHNYIPKNFLGLGTNANLSGSNSTTSYGIEPFSKSDKDRNSNNVCDNNTNFYEYTANQYNTQFQQQLNNQFDTWSNNDINMNVNNSECNVYGNKMINNNIMHQQRTPVTMRNNNFGNEGMMTPFIFDAKPPQIPPYANGQNYNNGIGMLRGNIFNNYFNPIQMIQQKNFIEYTNALNKQNTTISNENPFQAREDSNKKENNVSITKSINSNNNMNHMHNEKKIEDKNQQSSNTSKTIDDPKEYLLEMFGRLGWICNKCNNFNYETRNRCNRCLADKEPRSLAEIQKKNKEKEESAQNKKKAKEQKVDWVCTSCSNLNFGFRKVCNRCQLPKSQP